MIPTLPDGYRHLDPPEYRLPAAGEMIFLEGTVVKARAKSKYEYWIVREDLPLWKLMELNKLIAKLDDQRRELREQIPDGGPHLVWHGGKVLLGVKDEDGYVTVTAHEV